MTDWLLALVPQYGVWLLVACTFLSCLGLPIPASILMLTAGGFVAAGDLSLTGNVAAALGGAVAGDQAGYFGGLVALALMLAFFATQPDTGLTLLGRPPAFGPDAAALA